MARTRTPALASSALTTAISSDDGGNDDEDDDEQQREKQQEQVQGLGVRSLLRVGVLASLLKALHLEICSQLPDDVAASLWVLVLNNLTVPVSVT
jgi:hypothetical protein